MKWLSGVTTWFLPFAFAMALSWLTVWNREAAAPAFYSFLPMAFFFVGSALLHLSRLVTKLEDRIKRLEGAARSGAA